MCEPRVAGDDRITRLNCCPNTLSREIDRDGNRLRPAGNHCSRAVNLRLNRDEAMLRD